MGAMVLLVPNSRALFVLTFTPAVVLTSLSVSIPAKFRIFKFAGDYSYGIYLWAYPVQQCLIAVLPGMTPLRLFAAALPITFVLAVASWHLIESQALAFKPVQRVVRAAKA
jgi:peptidoglycan/LPS O-acetylase OafA/YrhL